MERRPLYIIQETDADVVYDNNNNVNILSFYCQYVNRNNTYKYYYIYYYIDSGKISDGDVFWRSWESALFS
jgi:hypothetical protein